MHISATSDQIMEVAYIPLDEENLLIMSQGILAQIFLCQEKFSETDDNLAPKCQFLVIPPFVAWYRYDIKWDLIIRCILLSPLAPYFQKICHR